MRATTTRIDEAPPSGRRLRVALATLGCKVNQYDTATMETALRERCEIVPFDTGADVYVVNSCTVTDRADAESRQLARRARRLNPSGRVILTGCFAQTSPQRAALPEVDYVIGVGRLPDLLRAVYDQIPQNDGRILVHDLRRAEQVSTLGAEVFGGQTRAFLKVQEGCDLFCTFCIVPFARGRSRSVEPRRVLAELERLAARGFREVVLTGIHLGGYGKDLTSALTLTDLLEMIAEVSPVPRIRLSSIDPPEINPRLLALVAGSGVFCPHFHVFPYSRRSGTTAAKLGGHLPPQTVAARARALRRVGAAKRRAFAERFVGAELDVLVETTRDRETGRLVGYSRNYARVLLDGPDTLGNTEVRVRAVARHGDRLLAVGAPADRAGHERAV